MSDEVIDRLAPEFASFPNLFGYDHKGRDIQGTSFYGQGGKSADFIKDLYNKSSGMKMSSNCYSTTCFTTTRFAKWNSKNQ